MHFASAPKAKKNGKPASTLWWDGVVIAKNVTDEEAEAAFKLAMVGLDPENLGANPEAAPWLSNAFDPAPSNIGAILTAKSGANLSKCNFQILHKDGKFLDN